jgi:hypothetical protein
MSPVHVLQMNPVHVLQVQSSPGFTTCRITVVFPWKHPLEAFCFAFFPLKQEFFIVFSNFTIWNF